MRLLFHAARAHHTTQRRGHKILPLPKYEQLYRRIKGYRSVGISVNHTIPKSGYQASVQWNESCFNLQMYLLIYALSVTPSWQNRTSYQFMMTFSNLEHFPHYWPFVRGIHWSPVISPHKRQWRGALVFSLICVWINGWVNNRKAGDLRRHCAH